MTNTAPAPAWTRVLARIIAFVWVACEATYHAGRLCGKALHSVNDWLAAASHDPIPAASQAAEITLTILERAATAILTAPKPQPQQAGGIPVPAEWGAILLSSEQLEAEIAQFDATARKKPTVRRKPATARKAKAAV
jgi:hypothetical protein